MSTVISQQPLIDLEHHGAGLSVNDVQDLSKVCRLCGIVPPQPVLPIFGQECRKKHISEKINHYLPIKVDEMDPLPKTVCHSCAQLIVRWHKFSNRSVEVESTLKLRCGQEPPIATNEQNSTNLNENINNEAVDTYTYTAGTSVGTWSPYSDQDGRYGDGCNETNVGKIAESDGDSIASDDAPLASLANRKTTRNLYQDFYNALKKFRDHFVNNHHGQCNYSDFSDTSDSDDEDVEDMDLNDFDDLTESNMRKDRMDEETRVELSEVQTKVNGKVYFTCKICGKNLSSSHTYMFHKRIHTGERPCVCHVCGKQFRVPNGLQRHLTETHLKQRRYICVLCHKNFANSQNLKQHMRIHTGERPYVCSQCGKRFTQSGSLHVHLKTHTEIFPHNCADCGAKFRLRSSLKRHRLKHTGERPHVCVHCGKGFRQKHELSSHVLTHTDTKPHACAACGAAFRQRRALRHHCRRLHGADTLYD